MIERFYEPHSGEILLDGHNIKDLDLKWLRQQIGLVNQEPALFATSIRENILYGKDDATIDELTHAAKLSEAINFINNLPERYETQVIDQTFCVGLFQIRFLLCNKRIVFLYCRSPFVDAEVVVCPLDRS